MRARSGFSLVEIMVAISIVSLLAAVITMNVIDAGKQSRDADRQADLRTLQSALELYKLKYGRYPAACRGANTWSGQSVPTSPYRCASGDQYITGNADTTDFDGDGNTTEIIPLAPEFIPALPKDPRPNGNPGYVYRVNAEGTVYKLMIARTVESESVDETHPFHPCDVVGGAGVCAAVYFNGNSVAPKCDPYDSNTDFETSYAVWGGYPFEPFSSVTRREEQLENTICRML